MYSLGCNIMDNSFSLPSEDKCLNISISQIRKINYPNLKMSFISIKVIYFSGKEIELRRL